MVRTRVGYTGGRTAAPSYHLMGDHSEAIQIDFDPARIDYPALLASFFSGHRPIHPPHSRQYRSAIFHSGEGQRRAAQAALAEQERRLGKQLYTELAPLERFHLAEDYHQKYYLRGHPPLLAAFEGYTPEAFVDSTVAARLNGLLGGVRGGRRLDAEVEGYGLPPPAERYLRRAIGG